MTGNPKRDACLNVQEYEGDHFHRQSKSRRGHGNNYCTFEEFTNA